jgi:hypothetical protein
MGIYYIKLADGRAGTAAPQSTDIPAPILTAGSATLDGTTLTKDGESYTAKLSLPPTPKPTAKPPVKRKR